VLRFSALNAFRRKGIAVTGVAMMTVLSSISDGMDAEMTSNMIGALGWPA